MNNEVLDAPYYEPLQERINLLFEALIQCSQLQEKGRNYIFTRAERILINQERAAILSQLNRVSNDENNQLRYYRVAENIEKKIQIIKSKL